VAPTPADEPVPVAEPVAVAEPVEARAAGDEPGTDPLEVASGHDEGVPESADNVLAEPDDEPERAAELAESRERTAEQ
jgi:hypothetical protein